PLTVDVTISRMMGVDPAKLRFLQVAHGRGYGDYRENHIEIIGHLEPIPHFKLPPFLDETGEAAIPGSPQIMERQLKLRPRAERDLCTGCGTCIEACPVSALSMKDETPAVDPGKCIVCFCCQEKCPERAIQLC
ncbi:MAG: 4Fe-4S binding protein, partial [Deltaproteobacteria bacterium]|nr:4Fe-4S binding protein [Deltaproteobacteria bacterium]